MRVLPVTLLCSLHPVHVKHPPVELVLAFATTTLLEYFVLAVIAQDMNRWTKKIPFSYFFFGLLIRSKTLKLLIMRERKERQVERTLQLFSFWSNFYIFNIIPLFFIIFVKKEFLPFLVITSAAVAMNCDYDNDKASQ